MFRNAVLFVLLSPFCVLAGAQTPTAVPASAAAPLPQTQLSRQTQLAAQNAEMNQAALKVAQMIDTDQVGQVWDGASAVAKKAVVREAFVSQVMGERRRLGALVGRGAASVTRVKYGLGAQVPEGLYVNVSFPSRFANLVQPVRELVSFRLDEDKVWRLSGYSMRMPAN